jgi:cell wall-associated NlpC family hydrolase
MPARSLGNFAGDLISALGGKPNPASQKLFSSWQRWEGGHTANSATWNPLNLTAPGSGLPTINQVGVVAMPSEQVGVQRTANLIKSGYPSLAAAFASGKVNFSDPGIQGDLNRWLSGKRTPGMTPYVSKIAAAYGQGGTQPYTSAATPPPAPQTQTLPGIRQQNLPGGRALDSLSLANSLVKSFVSGGGRINMMDLPGMTEKAMKTTPAIKAPSIPAEKVPKWTASGQQDTAGRTGVVSSVRQWLGTPYSWGGGGPAGPSKGFAQGANITGFDCSSLLQYGWAKAGVSIPRTTYSQWTSGRPVQNPRPGDAVFFNMSKRGPEHVGIFIGNGKFIEAPHTGANVRISELAGRSDYVGARTFA